MFSTWSRGVRVLNSRSMLLFVWSGGETHIDRQMDTHTHTNIYIYSNKSGKMLSDLITVDWGE